MSTSRSRDNLLALLYFQQYRAGAEQDFRASVISVALTEHVSPLPEQRYENTSSTRVRTRMVDLKVGNLMQNLDTNLDYIKL